MHKVDAFVAKYADTEFKDVGLQLAPPRPPKRRTTSAKVIIYCDLAMEAEPESLHPMLMESGELARSTRENDLDKDEKLAKAENWSIRRWKSFPPRRSRMRRFPTPQWEEMKKEYHGRRSPRSRHDRCGPEEVRRGRQRIQTGGGNSAAQPDPAAFIRLAAAYTDNKQPDEALAVLAKMPATRQLAPFVAREKKRAETLKATQK